MTMSFLAPGPLFAFQTASIFQKGVWQRFFQDWLQTRSFCQLLGPFLITQRSSFVKKGSGSLFFKLAWSDIPFVRSCAPFRSLSGPNPSKRSPRPPNLTLASFSLQQSESIPSFSVYVDVKPGSWEYMCYLPVCESSTTPDNPNTQGQIGSVGRASAL